MKKIDRRNFLKGGLLTTTMLPLAGCSSMSFLTTNRENMCGYSAPKMDKVRVAIIGIGSRGIGAVSRLSKINDVEVVALCDIKEKQTKWGQSVLKKNGRKPAKEFFGSEEIWRDAVNLDIDLVYIVTPWELHTPMAVYAMENGKHAAMEVPAATTVEECWQLVETSEKTGKHAMMLENCCYDFFELQTFNMVRQGVFGRLTHAEAAYIHSMPGLANYPSKSWRGKHNYERNGNLYPTHGLGPVAQCMDINRGNKFEVLTSLSSSNASAQEWMKKHNKEIPKPFGYRGDMNTTTILCNNGETIMVQHDVTSPRPYSRIHLLQGSKGFARKWPSKKIALSSHHNGHRWLNDDEMKELEKKYAHPLTKTIGSIARKVGGHGGMDFIMDYRLIYCLKNGLPLDQDVYDAAAWSVITPLSVESVKKRGGSIEIPDFTRGKWKTNKPFGVVNVDPTKLAVNIQKKDGAKQLNVH